MRPAMEPYPSGGSYFRDPREIAQVLGLSYLGSLAADPHVQELTGSLAGLAPDPRFSERLFRFVNGELPLVWVAGLGDAGEEIPVAVGLAARAATKGIAPVLLVRPGETLYPGAGEVEGRPVEAGAHFGEALAGLGEGHWGASATGIQGVYRAWRNARPEGDALWPAAIVVASGGFADCPGVAPQATHLILVIPFRDQPRERIESALEAMAAFRDRLIGFVAYGSLGDTPHEAAATERIEPMPAPALTPLSDRPRPAAPGDLGDIERQAAKPAGREGEETEPDSAAPAPRDDPQAQEGPETARGAEAREREEESPAVAGPQADLAADEIRAAQAWTESFGPRKTGRSARDWLVRAAVGLILAGIAIGGVGLLRPELLFGSRGMPRAPISDPRPVAGPAETPSEGTGPARMLPPTESDFLPAAGGDTLGASEEIREDLVGEPGLEADTQGGETETALRATERVSIGLAGEAEEEVGAKRGDGGGAFPAVPVVEEPDALESPDAARESPDAARVVERARDSVSAREVERVDAPAAPRAQQSAPPVADSAQSAAPVRAMVPTRDGPYAVLCGSFQSEDRAASEVARLSAAGHPARSVAVAIPERGVWQRVLVGEFAEVEAALALARRLADGEVVPACQVVAGGGRGMVIGRPVTGGGS